MATTIVTKNGSGAPTASDLVAGELAVDLTNGRLYTEDSGGSVIEIGLNPSGNVDITGTATMDGLTVDGQGKIQGSFALLDLVETDITDKNTRVITSGGQFRVDTVNDALSSSTKRIMVDHATGDISFFEDTGTTAKLFWDASAERLVIGDNTVTPSGDAGDLVVGGSTGNNGITIGSATTGSGSVRFADTGGTGRGLVFYDHSSDFMALHTAGTEKMRIASSGNVGIGRTPTEMLDIQSGSGDARIRLEAPSGSDTEIKFFNDGAAQYTIGHDDATDNFVIGGANVDGPLVSVTKSGNLLVGKTSTGDYVTGIEMQPAGAILSYRTTNVASIFGRTNDGEITRFTSAGSIVGSIGTLSSALTIGTGDTGVQFNADNNAIMPHNISTGANVDNSIDIGYSSGGTNRRFKDLYLSGTANVGTLSVNAGTGNIAATFESTDSGSYINIIDNSSGTFGAMIGAIGDDIVFSPNNVEAARISGSNLLVGKTGTGAATAGIELNGANDILRVTKASGSPVELNRQSLGDIIDLRKDNTTVGTIGSRSAGANLYITFRTETTGDGCGLTGSSASSGAIIPSDGNGDAIDDHIDLGASGTRFDDIYATSGTVNSSDGNEKQDIEELSDAEQRVAVACKGLLRKFRWISRVAEKGDDARIHFGIIAQDLQAAFEAEGLDAGRYGMFINGTWTDEETGEERSRMGVRYSELLAFIIAAI